MRAIWAELGVALFFAISGYLITTLLLEEHDRLGRISLRGFYLRRGVSHSSGRLLLFDRCGDRRRLRMAGRIAAPWRTSERGLLLWQLLAGALLVHRALLVAFDGGTFLSAVAGTRGLWERGGRSSLPASLLAATALWRPWSLAHVNLPYPALQRTDMRLDAFLYAGLLAILLYGPYRVPVLRVLTAAWFRACSVLAVVAAWTWMLARSAPGTGTLVESALLPAILVAVIYWPGSRLFRILEWAPLRWMGRISYGLYLWQQLFFSPEPVRYRFLPRPRCFSRALGSTFAAAIASYCLLERPLLTYGRIVSSRFQNNSRATPSGSKPSSIMEQ